MITLTNDFHGTSARIRIAPESQWLSPRTVRRIRQQLCGSGSCTCSENALGTRGPQAYEGNHIRVTEMPGGEVCLEILYPNHQDMQEKPARSETPIFKAERSHTGGYLCAHNHRTVTGAARCLPVPPRGQGAYSMARVVPMNASARALLQEQQA